MKIKLHLSSLPPEQQQIWSLLTEADMSGFMLYGGTALVLRFGHRLSVDFDFFGSALVTPESIAKRIPWLRDRLDEVIQEEQNTYTVNVCCPGIEFGNTVKLSFFGEIGFPTLEKPHTATNGIEVAGIRDILATKLKAIFGRVEAKDYIDIAEILRRSDDPVLQLQEGLADFELLFPGGNPHLVLKSLCWFESEGLTTLDKSIRKLLENTVSSVNKIPPAKPVFRQNIGIKGNGNISP